MIVYNPHIRRADLQENPERLYIFGDNAMRTGFGGQAAEMRGEPNAVGIVTKFAPDMRRSSFFDDENTTVFRSYLLDPYRRLRGHLDAGGTIICPENGVGTDRAELPLRAPKCFGMLCRMFTALGIRPPGPEWRRYMRD